MRTPKTSVVTLAFLSPLVGEFLLGNVTIRDIGALLFLVPLYGGGAVLVREAARRTGKGWPTILALGFAYGLLEAGVFDGSLFSASYEGMDYSGARIPGLGVSAFHGLQFVVNHAVWSIGIPILLTESLTPRRRTTPWLGRIGLTVTAVVYLAGGLLIRQSSVSGGDYHVSWAQAAGVVLVALVWVAIAFLLPAPPSRRPTGWVPRPWLLGVASFLLSSTYFVLPATWPGVGLTLAIVGLAAWLVARAGRRAGWRNGHQVALAAGALMTYAWAGFLVTGLKHHADALAFVGNAAFTVGAIVLIVATAQRPTATTAHRARRGCGRSAWPRRAGCRQT